MEVWCVRGLDPKEFDSSRRERDERTSRSVHPRIEALRVYGNRVFRVALTIFAQAVYPAGE